MLMELVADSRRLVALDLVEVNPTLDVRNTTAELAVETGALGARQTDHLTEGPARRGRLSRPWAA